MSNRNQNNKRALFISPTSALSPLLQAQGIPHIRELSKYGFCFILFTLEGKWNNEEYARAEKLRIELSKIGINWVVMRQSRTPILPSSTFDILRGAIYIIYLTIKAKISIIHVRSYVPAFVVLFAKIFCPIKFIFDTRGLLPEEYIEKGYWSITGWQYKTARWLSKKCFQRADAIIVVTSDTPKKIISYFHESKDTVKILEKISIIHNTTDLNRFQPNDKIRLEMRKAFALEDKLVFLWLVGGICKWHMPEQVINFFNVCRRKYFDSKLLVITQTPNTDKLIEKMGTGREDYLIVNATPEDVSKFILMGDIGISFIDPAHSGSAIKLAEYLACCLPVVVSGHQEVDKIVLKSRVGIVLKDFENESLRTARNNLEKLINEGENIRLRCRKTAEEYFSLHIAIEKYLRVYEDVINDK